MNTPAKRNRFGQARLEWLEHLALIATLLAAGAVRQWVPMPTLAEIQGALRLGDPGAASAPAYDGG